RHLGAGRSGIRQALTRRHTPAAGGAYLRERGRKEGKEWNSKRHDRDSSQPDAAQAAHRAHRARHHDRRPGPDHDGLAGREVEQPGCQQYSTFKFSYASGHPIDDNGTGQVVLGSDIAKEFKKKVGDSMELPQPPKKFNPDFVSHQFTVVGILDKTLTAPDNFAIVSFKDGQTLFGDALPTALKGHVDPTQLATC